MTGVGGLHTFNPSTQNAEAGRSLYVWVKPDLQSEFEDRQLELQNETLSQNKNTSKTEKHKQNKTNPSLRKTLIYYYH